jgi:deoxyadenosine/deoxycytidine kinase
MEDIMREMGEKKEMRFVERSIYSYKHVFARSLYEAGKMSSLEWKMYENWFEWLSQEKFGTLHKAKGYIYLRANPQTSYDRMVKRERDEEKAVPLDYLENINRYHDEWLKTMQEEDVLVIDVDEDFENNEEVWKEMYKRIIDFVKSKE